MAPAPAPTAPTGSAAARLLAAVRLQPADSTPVWFMRQAGRSLPQYRELRRRLEFMELVRDPELAAAITCMPVDLLGVDGAVVFADIMLPLLGMGVDFSIQEQVGPVVSHPIRSGHQVAAMLVKDAEEATPFVFRGVELARSALGDRAALIGFGAAPFTLACYLVEGRGSRDFPHVRALLHSDPRLWHRLMATLTEVLSRYLVAQAEAGAQVVQLFDSWAGVLDRRSFLEHVAPHLVELVDRVRQAAPVIYFSTGSSHLLDLMSAAGPDGLSVDWRLPLDRAWDLIGASKFIQGNLDPALLLAPWSELELGVRRVLGEAGGRPGHIFNLGHGVIPETQLEQLRRVVELVHRESSAALGHRAAGATSPGDRR